MEFQQLQILGPTAPALGATGNGDVVSPNYSSEDSWEELEARHRGEGVSPSNTKGHGNVKLFAGTTPITSQLTGNTNSDARSYGVQSPEIEYNNTARGDITVSSTKRNEASDTPRSLVSGARPHALEVPLIVKTERDFKMSYREIQKGGDIPQSGLGLPNSSQDAKFSFGITNADSLKEYSQYSNPDAFLLSDHLKNGHTAKSNSSECYFSSESFDKPALNSKFWYSKISNSLSSNRRNSWSPNSTISSGILKKRQSRRFSWSTGRKATHQIGSNNAISLSPNKSVEFPTELVGNKFKPTLQSETFAFSNYSQSLENFKENRKLFEDIIASNDADTTCLRYEKISPFRMKNFTKIKDNFEFGKVEVPQFRSLNVDISDGSRDQVHYSLDSYPLSYLQHRMSTEAKEAQNNIRTKYETPKQLDQHFGMHLNKHLLSFCDNDFIQRNRYKYTVREGHSSSDQVDSHINASNLNISVPMDEDYLMRNSYRYTVRESRRLSNNGNVTGSQLLSPTQSCTDYSYPYYTQSPRAQVGSRRVTPHSQKTNAQLNRKVYKSESDLRYTDYSDNSLYHSPVIKPTSLIQPRYPPAKFGKPVLVNEHANYKQLPALSPRSIERVSPIVKETNTKTTYSGYGSKESLQSITDTSDELTFPHFSEPSQNKAFSHWLQDDNNSDADDVPQNKSSGFSDSSINTIELADNYQQQQNITSLSNKMINTQNDRELSSNEIPANRVKGGINLFESIGLHQNSEVNYNYLVSSRNQLNHTPNSRSNEQSHISSFETLPILTYHSSPNQQYIEHYPNQSQSINSKDLTENSQPHLTSQSGEFVHPVLRRIQAPEDSLPNQHDRNISPSKTMDISIGDAPTIRSTNVINYDPYSEQNRTVTKSEKQEKFSFYPLSGKIKKLLEGNRYEIETSSTDPGFIVTTLRRKTDEKITTIEAVDNDCSIPINDEIRQRAHSLHDIHGNAETLPNGYRSSVKPAPVREVEKSEQMLPERDVQVKHSPKENQPKQHIKNDQVKTFKEAFLEKTQHLEEKITDRPRYEKAKTSRGSMNQKRYQPRSHSFAAKSHMPSTYRKATTAQDDLGIKSSQIVSKDILKSQIPGIDSSSYQSLPDISAQGVNTKCDSQKIDFKANMNLWKQKEKSKSYDAALNREPPGIEHFENNYDQTFHKNSDSEQTRRGYSISQSSLVEHESSSSSPLNLGKEHAPHSFNSFNTPDSVGEQSFLTSKKELNLSAGSKFGFNEQLSSTNMFGGEQPLDDYTGKMMHAQSAGNLNGPLTIRPYQPIDRTVEGDTKKVEKTRWNLEEKQGVANQDYAKMNGTVHPNHNYNNKVLTPQSPDQKTAPLSVHIENRLFAQALYTFKPMSDKELGIKKGDHVAIIRSVDENWFEGESLTGNIGIFPKTYVKILRGDDSNAIVSQTTKYLVPNQPNDNTRSGSALSQPNETSFGAEYTQPNEPRLGSVMDQSNSAVTNLNAETPIESLLVSPSFEGRATAKFNFRAETSVELDLVKGQLLALIKRVDANWYEGHLLTPTPFGEQRIGIFPAAYIEVHQEPAMPSDSARNILGHTTSLNSNFGSSQPPNLSSSVKSPNSTQQPMNNHLKNLQTNQARAYRSIYPYNPQNADELELIPGDVVYVVEVCNDGWFVGSSGRTGQFGTFPGNYVEVLT